MNEPGNALQKVHRDSNIIFAAGGLLWREKKGQMHIALVYRKSYQDWTLPKGKVNSADEDLRSTAQREVKEETGFDSEIIGFAGCICYEHNHIPKVVLFWHMVTKGESDFKESEEVERCEWLLVDEAIHRLTYPKERDLIVQHLAYNIK
jgi:8-oxo-dGTP pyrophosphatase MutT (NUDIX family)